MAGMLHNSTEEGSSSHHSSSKKTHQMPVLLDTHTTGAVVSTTTFTLLATILLFSLNFTLQHKRYREIDAVAPYRCEKKGTLEALTPAHGLEPWYMASMSR